MIIGTWLFTKMRGELVGTDAEGNRYFQDKRVVPGMRRKRWVMYNGVAEASRVPPEWHGWLRNTYPDPPTVAPLLRRSWEKDHLPNLTGTVHAWRPQGAIARGGERQAATGDYQAWKPE